MRLASLTPCCAQIGFLPYTCLHACMLLSVIKQGCERVVLVIKYYVNSTRCTVAFWRMRIYYNVHPVRARSIRWPETCLFASHLSCETCEGKKPETESAISVAMTRAMSSHELSCLASCSPLHVSAHCCLCSVQSVQEASVCARN